MSDLLRFNPDYLLSLCGLKNNGVLCYLNSLVQCLGGCPSFWETLLKKRDKYERNTDDYKIENALLKIYDETKRDSENNKSGEYTVPSNSTVELLRAIRSQRKAKGEILNLVDGEQECLHLGLQYMIDVMGQDIKNLFLIRYSCEVSCKKCKRKNKKDDDGANFMVTIFEEENVIKDALGSSPDSTMQKSYENYIKKTVQLPDAEYKCEGCKAHNEVDSKGNRSGPIEQTYYLRMISEIVVVVFNQYFEKREYNFPDELEFPATGGKILKYKVVSVAEHIGSRHGGHYTARSIRIRSQRFKEERLKRWNKYSMEQRDKIGESIIKIEAKIKEEKTKKNVDNARMTSLKSRLKELKDREKEIKEKGEAIKEDNDSDSKTMVWSLNDDHNVIPCSEGFGRSKKIYVVFYHLQ